MQLKPDIIFTRRLQRWSGYLTGVVVGIAVAVLFGWQFDVEILKHPLPGLAGMNPMTAVLFLFSGSSFLLLTAKNGSPRKKLYGNILAILVLLTGMLKMLTLVPGFRFEVDELLFAGRLKAAIGVNVSNSMGPSTAVCFILSGLTLLLLNVETRHKQIPSQFIVLLINMGGFFSLMGYLYHIQSFYGVLAYIPMAIQSTFCFIFFSFAVLFAHPEKGFMREFTSTHTGSILARSIIPTVVLVPLLLGLVRLYGAWKEWYGNEFGVAIFALSIILVFLLLTWYNTKLLNRRDVQKIETEKALKESEEQVQAIFKAAPDAVIVINGEGCVVQWNQQSTTLFGWTAEEITGKRLSETIIPAQYREAHMSGLERFVKTGQSRIFGSTLELKALRKDQTSFDISLSIAPTRVDDQYLFIGFIRDITEQKRIEGQLKRFNEDLEEQVRVITAEIRKNEEKFRTLVEQASDGIFISDEEGRYVEVNNTGCQLVGYSREEILAMRIPDLIVKDEDFVPLRWNQIKAGRSVVQTRKLRKKDGSVLLTEISSKQLQDGRMLGIVRDITERKKAEQQLAESEKNLRDVLSSSADSFYVIDRDCRVTLINQQASRNLEKAWGHPVTVGTIILDLIPDEKSEPIRESLEKVFSGEQVEYEHYILLPGLPPWWMVTYMPVRDEKQNVVGAYIATKNITERKKAEEAVSRYNERFELISRTTNDAVWDWNLDSNELWANETHQHLYGLTVNDPVPTVDIWEQRIHPDDREKIIQLQHATLASASNIFISEYRFDTGKGNYKTLYDRCYIIRDKEGKPLRMTGSMMDITERKKAEEEIKRSREQLLASIENTPNVAVQWYNENGEVVFWNRASESIFGWTTAEATGQTLDKLIHTPEETAGFVQTLQQVKETGRPVGPVEYSFIHRNGSRRFCFSTLFSIPSVSGEPRFVCMHVDITEQKRAEDALRKSEERYRTLVENATEALVVLDMEKGKFVNVSESAERLFKMTREELLSIGPVEVSPEYQPDGRLSAEAAMIKINAAIAGDKPSFEWTHIDKQGNQIPCEIWLVRLPSESQVLIRGSIVDITERKKAEMALKESEEKYRSLIEQASDGILITNPERKYIEANPSACKMLGYTREELLKLSISDVVPEEELAKQDRQIGILESGESVITERKMKRKNGSLLQAELSLKQLSGGRFQAIMRDITERKKAEEALRKSEERYRSLIEQASDFIMITDQAGNFIDVNSSICKTFGYTREELLQSNITALIDPQQLKTDPIRFELLTSGDTILRERRMIHKDGTIVEVEANVKLLPDGRVLAIARNIEERKKAAQELKESENRLRTILATDPECIKLLDRACRLIDINPAGIKMIEANSLEEIRGKSLLPVVAEQHREAAAKLVEEAHQGKPGRLEFEMLTFKGNHRWCEINIVPFRNAEGAILHALGVTRDITEKKKAEIELIRNEEKYRSLIEQAVDAIALYDAKGRILDVNTGAANLLGYTKEELMKMTLSDVLTKEELKTNPVRYDVLKKGESTVKQRNMRRKNGSIVQTEVRSQQLPDGRFLSVIRDLSERIKAEQELNASYAAIRKLTGYLQDIREEERTHIAREIHDELGQQLTVLKMDVSWVLKKMNKEDKDIERKIRGLLEMLDSTVRSVRRISSQLRPSVLDDLGLVAAMEWHLKEFEQRSGIFTVLKAPESAKQMPDTVKTGLFRIFQESLTNVARHAEAKKVEVNLQYSGKQLILSIADDGKGFDRRMADTKRTLGILGMKERTVMMGGSYEIESIPGRGTTVLVTIPEQA